MKLLNLSINFSNTTKMVIDFKIIKNIANDFLINQQQSGDVILDISIVGTSKMRMLNRQYRQIDAPTDVLSFPMSQVSDLKSPVLLGSIVICPKIVTHYLKSDIYPSPSSGQIDFNDAIIYVVKHGLAHLLGYNHDSDMNAKQFDSIINQIQK